MLRTLLYAAAVGAIAFAFAVVAFSAWRLPSQPNQTQNGASATSAADRPNDVSNTVDANNALATYTLWLTVFTGVLAVVALVQIGFLISADSTSTKSAKSAQAAVDLARTTAERQLRAYVFPRGGQITNFGPDKKFEVAVILRNSGQTPAYQFVSGGAVSVADYPLKEPLITQYDDTGHTGLGPGTEFAVRWVATVPLPKDLAAAVSGGTKAIYADGVFSYRDAFGETRVGKYRLFFGGKTGTPQSGEMSFYHEGNE